MPRKRSSKHADSQRNSPSSRLVPLERGGALPLSTTSAPRAAVDRQHAPDSAAVVTYADPFYPQGITAIRSPRVHYLHVGCRVTRAVDYFRHVDIHQGTTGHENAASSSPKTLLQHDVVWLHAARPRDRFVFMVGPVDGGMPLLSWKNKLAKFLYGNAPRFAVDGRAGNPRRGFECIEVPHADVTAMDYSAALTGVRLAVETRSATSRWFPSEQSVYDHYQIIDWEWTSCTESMRGSIGSASGDVTPAHSSGGGRRSSSLLSPGWRSARHQHRHHHGNAGILSGDQSPARSGVPSASPSGSDFDGHYDEGLASGGHAGSSYDEDDTRFGLSEEEFPDLLERKINNSMLVVFSQDPHFTSVMREFLQPIDILGPSNALQLRERGNYRRRYYSTSGGRTAGTQSRSRPGPGGNSGSGISEGDALVASNESRTRLLKLYESGIPSWAIFCCRWGLPYKRWFRVLAVTLLNVWPLIALLVGLYDLYKHMPLISQWLTPWTEWMEGHFTFRVSVVVAYMFTVLIQALGTFVRLAKSIAAVVGFFVSPLYPLWQFILLLHSPLAWLASVLTSVGRPFVLLLSVVWSTLCSTVTLPYYASQLLVGVATARSAVQPVAATVTSASRTVLMWRAMLKFWQDVARPVKNLLKAMYDGVMHLGVQIVKREISLRLWYTRKSKAFVRAIGRAVTAVEAELASPTWRSLYLLSVVVLVVAVLWWSGVIFS